MLNPVGFATYYLFRTIGVGDVPKRWFVNRKLRYCLVQGPGVFAFEGETEGTSFKSVSFDGCDFIVVPEMSWTVTAYPLDGVKANHVRFKGCTFLVPESFYQHLKRSVTKESEVPNRIEGKMPATAGGL